MTDDTELEETIADLSAAGWSVYKIGDGTAAVEITFRRDSMPGHREITDRNGYGKTLLEAIRRFLMELAEEQGSDSSPPAR